MSRNCEIHTPLGFNQRDIWHIFKYVLREIKDDNVRIIAAGVAFFTMLAIFPLITACLSIYGYVADPATAHQHLMAVSTLLPEQAWNLVNDQVQSVAKTPNSGLGIRIAVSLILALWAAGAGIRAMMRALNVAYGEKEKRNVMKFNGLAILLTLSMTTFIWTALTVIVGVPAVLAIFKLEEISSTLTRVLPWGLLILFFFLTNIVLYRFGPSRRAAKMKWLLPGVIFSTLSWLLLSACFSYFVATFNTYNATYGSLSAVIILLVWLWLTAFVVLVGAEINAELERHTSVDTTCGPDRPLGERGAAMADYLVQDYEYSG